MRRLRTSYARVWRWSQLLALVILELPAHAQTSVAHLAEYHAVVTFATQREARVTATLKPEAGVLIPSLLLARLRGDHLLEITASDAEGELPIRTSDLPGAVLLTLSAPSSKPGGLLQIHYLVTSNNPLERIPLPTVSLPMFPEQRTVSIEAKLPVGMTAVGEGFPVLIWHSPVQGETRLFDVPSVLAVKIRTDNTVTWRSRLMTASGLSTVGMFTFLGAGSLFWYLRTQMRQSGRS